MSTRTATTQAEIWRRAIQPDIGDLSVDAARALLRLKIADEDLERVRELSDKISSDSVSDEETRELDHYLSVGRTMEFIKAKARLSLRDASA
jgi:hypothetical protein